LSDAVNSHEPTATQGDNPIASMEAEHAVLGILLCEPDLIHALPEQLTEDSFFEHVHAAIFAEIAEAVRRGWKTNTASISSALQFDPAFTALGGIVFLADLMDACPVSSELATYADLMVNLATRRELVRLGSEITKQAKATREAREVIEGAEKALAQIAQAGSDATTWITAGEATLKAIREAQERDGPIGLSTGLRDLDEQIGGLRDGQMVVLGGRPGMGKSTGALTIAKAVAGLQGRGCVFFSMEMPEFDLGLRLACDVAHDRYNGALRNPTYYDAARNKLNAHEWSRLEAAQREIATWPLEIDTRPGLTVGTMRAAARRKFREWERKGIKPGAIIVDHLTIAKPEGERAGNKVAEVGDISRGLAEMAKTLNVPVVALCQLSRGVEGRGNDKRPTLADLRWSGEIEQDARVIAFMYRPAYYLREPDNKSDVSAMAEYQQKKQDLKWRLDWLVEKNSNGPTGEVETYVDIGASAIRDKSSD